ncbi:hypothetical protein [Streptomyces sp. NBC_00354]|uniref:hypothetical protein n=1 Tax=Streptomyces sp. NBC_00354 TaxID=2975723 RepID=UPI002E25B4DE
MSHRTTRTTRLKTATMVGAGVLAVALNVVPTTTAIADAIHRSGTDTAVALPGPSGVMGDGDHGGKRGPQGPQGKPGKPGRPGHEGREGREGRQGPQGFQGTQGFQGDPGTPGTPGTQGFQGFQGFQGTQGFQGQQGETGAVTTYVRFAIGAQGTATATCDPGDLATGGGFQSDSGNVRFNGPVGSPPNAWQAAITANQPVTAFVVCVDQP